MAEQKNRVIGLFSGALEGIQRPRRLIHLLRRRHQVRITSEQSAVIVRWRRPWTEGGGRAVRDSPHQRPDLERDLVVPQRLKYWQTAAATAQATYRRHLEDLRRLQQLVWLPCGRWEGSVAVMGWWRSWWLLDCRFFWEISAGPSSHPSFSASYTPTTFP